MQPKRKSIFGGLSMGKRKRLKHVLIHDHSAEKSNPAALRRAIARQGRIRALAEQGLRITYDMDSETPGRDVRRSLKFGYVTVSNTVPDTRTLDINVNAGRDALGRAKAAFIKPGIKLHLGPEVPRFRVDPNNTKYLIRELNGYVDRGRLVDGAFIPAE